MTVAELGGRRIDVMDLFEIKAPTQERALDAAVRTLTAAATLTA